MAPHQVDDEYRKQMEEARKKLRDRIISDKKRYAPLMLHLALHDAGIYGFQSGVKRYWIKRGPNGSIRNQKEVGHDCNKGLQEAVDICENVKKEKCKDITYADLYQLAGIVAVEETGGPKIEFVPGRKDSTEFPEEGLVPDNDAFLLENIAKRMGLEEKDMVALFGVLNQWKLPVESSAGQAQGGATTQAVQGQGAATTEDFKFDNSYFRDLLEREPKNLLINKWVATYAKDPNAFRKDYGAAHKKVSELGMSGAKAAQGGDGTQTDQKSSAPASRNRVRLVQGIGIAVVTTAIILGFFLSRRSK